MGQRDAGDFCSSLLLSDTCDAGSTCALGQGGKGENEREAPEAEGGERRKS